MFERFNNPDKPFLEAVWSNICILSYAVPPELLAERVPEPLELDTRDGNALVSLVALDFEETKVWSVGWPGFRTFPEVHLHYYVRWGERRGVSLIREFVPQPFVAWMAGLLYNEPYEAVPMESSVERSDGTISVDHEWSHGGSIHRLRLTGEDDPYTPDEASSAHFFKEHRWGFGAKADGTPLAFEVEHPVWRVYPVESYDLRIDWDELFGRKWRGLKNEEPVSVLLAEGSPITLYPNQTLENLET